MMSQEPIDNSVLCQLLDDELPADERRRVLEEVRRDPSLRQRLHEYRRVRELVRTAFYEAGDTDGTQRRRWPTWSRSIAAGVLLVLGFAIGWTVHQRPGDTSVSQFAVANPSLHSLTRSAAAHPDGLHAILHVSSNNPADMETALDEAEMLLSSYRHEHKKLQLEVLANSSGLDLFRSDVSHFGRRIARMEKKYPNVSFLACRRTLERLRLEKKIQPHLLPGVRVVPSALDQILMRLNEGWVYVQA